MTADIEQIKKKIIYRSNYRGTKEMDWLMGKYIEATIASMDESKVDYVDALLKFAEPEIEAWLMGKSTDYPDEFADLIKEIQAFHEL